MRVAVARITLRLPHTPSLKEKRRLLKSLLAKIKQEFNVSIAEIDRLDDRRWAVLGVAFVSNDGRLNQRVIAQLISFIDRHPELMVEDYQSEIL
jgi:hypothetical protein